MLQGNTPVNGNNGGRRAPVRNEDDSTSVAGNRERPSPSPETLQLLGNAERHRLIDLKKVNDHVRPEEIALAQEQLERTRAAIAGARLRLDALRLVLEGPAPMG